MGSGNPSVLLAWGSTGAAVLAADIGSLIQNPAVLLGAAAVVVIAVLIVLIMVLRGGSKKAELAPEEEQGAWDSAPRGVPSQSGRGRDSREQMLPWEQGGAHAESGRQSLSARRGPAGRDAQAGWGQADQDAPPWEAQGQPSPRGGQWVGTDEWAPPEPAMGRSGPDQRGQGQMGARGNEGWPWGAGQAAGEQNGDQWGRAAGAPAGRGDDQWGQGPAVSPAAGRGDDQWGQGAAVSPAAGRGNDQWGQAPGNSRPRGPENDQWGQGPASPAMGRGNDQWGQQGPASPAMGRDNDQWGQGPAMSGRNQDHWGSPPAPNGYDAGQVEDQGYDFRAASRRGAEPAGQENDQWGQQGNWGQANAGWSGGEAAGQWGQPAAPAQSPQASRPIQPGNSRPNSQAGLAGMGNQSPSFPEAGSNWGEREAPAWQAAPRREQPSWEASSWQSAEPEPAGPRSGPRNQAPAQPQWDQPGRGTPEPAGGAAGAASQWGQPDAAPSRPSRPIEPAGAREMSQPAPSGGEWDDRSFDRPTVKPAPQSGSWGEREAPAWQAPAPQMAAPAGADAPTVRPGAPAGRLSQVSPEATAYAPAGDESGGDKTVVIRKDTGAARAPSVVVRQGKEPGRSYDVRKDHITIGRSRDSDIFLEDLAVSRLHATIYRDEMGGYLLRDENSANGTSVNGQRVSEVALQEGDEIQLGQTILAFVRR